MNGRGTNIPEQPNTPPFPKLNTNEGFSGTFDVSPESMEKLKKICGEVSVFTADQIGYVNKETGEKAEFVSKRKLKEILEKMKEYRDMERRGENYWHRPQVAERCFNLLQEVIEN